MKIDDLLSQFHLERTIEDFEYTRLVMKNIRDVLKADDFESMDSSLIYRYLRGGNRFVSFCDHLKRYIYNRMYTDKAFSEIEDEEYKEILKESFKRTGTPKSMTPTTKNWGAICSGWLTQEAVRRSTVFLLGFGLGMSVDDVSMFLTKVSREEDFRMGDPDEVVYWFCFKKGLGYWKAMQLLDRYSMLEKQPLPGDTGILKAEDMLLYKHYDPSIGEDSLMYYLGCLKGDSGGNQTDIRRKYFADMVQRAKERIAEYYTKDEGEVGSRRVWTAADVSNSDLEKWLCSGIPVNKDGNLEKVSRSRLGKMFDNQRMSRQRLDTLLKGKKAVERYDLLTMSFFLAALEPIDDPVERYQYFVRETNKMLDHCRLMDIYAVNPYEAFLLLCLMTEGPLAVYSDIWEMSYGTE